MLHRRTQRLSELADAARVAELTNPKMMGDNSVVLEQVAEIGDEVRRLGQRMEWVTTANVSSSPQARSPTPESRVASVDVEEAPDLPEQQARPWIPSRST